MPTFIEKIPTYKSDYGADDFLMSPGAE